MLHDAPVIRPHLSDTNQRRQLMTWRIVAALWHVLYIYTAIRYAPASIYTSFAAATVRTQKEIRMGVRTVPIQVLAFPMLSLLFHMQQMTTKGT